ncbi:MAG: ISAs1 family transposase [Candidatus Poribacteria bacterium]|nr:ISAs1 family transposase [Candidatus Poribacteria bacterium]
MLSQVPDPRQASKVRHPLKALLLHSILGVLGGSRGPVAIAEWGRHRPELASHLGYRQSKMPCAATFCRLFIHLDWQALVWVIQRWAEAWIQPEESASCPAALAVDGKTYRGSRKRGGQGCHVLTAVFHELGLTLGEAAVDDKTNEIPVATDLLGRLRLQNRVVTMDALLTQHRIAETILEHKGEYVMPVKGNHEGAHKELRLLFRQLGASPVSLSSAETVEKNRGRVEVRRLTAMSETDDWGDESLSDYFDWPGLQQVYRLEREVTVLKTEKRSHEVEYGFTSLSPGQADASALLGYRRGHWFIENGIHRVRDVTYDEDRSQVRCGNAPHNMGTLRNVAIALCRRHGRHNIAQANREIAAHPQRALEWLGISRS